jgi:hypothetical protein
LTAPLLSARYPHVYFVIQQGDLVTVFCGGARYVAENGGIYSVRAGMRQNKVL